VNLASRVEQLTKVYGVEIIVTEDTKLAAETLPFVEIDRVTVRGRQAAVGLFALHTGGKDENFTRLQQAQTEMLAAYRTGSFARALDILEANAGLYGQAYAQLYSYYINIIKNLMTDPNPNGRASTNSDERQAGCQEWSLRNCAR